MENFVYLVFNDLFFKDFPISCGKIENLKVDYDVKKVSMIKQAVENYKILPCIREIDIRQTNINFDNFVFKIKEIEKYVEKINRTGEVESAIVVFNDGEISILDGEIIAFACFKIGINKFPGLVVLVQKEKPG